jgi:hypothetical protein
MTCMKMSGSIVLIVLYNFAVVSCMNAKFARWGGREEMIVEQCQVLPLYMQVIQKLVDIAFLQAFGVEKGGTQFCLSKDAPPSEFLNNRGPSEGD